MNGKSSFAGLLMVSGISVAFALGYLMAKVSKNGRHGSDGFQKASGYSLDRFVDEGGGGKLKQGKSWQETKTRVLERWSASPVVVLDFDLNEETLRLLEKTTVTNLEVWMRELCPLGDIDWDKDISARLREMIMKVLVERGGGEFIRSLASNPLKDGDFDLDEMVDHWIGHDPKAVLEWMDGGNLPEELAEDLADYKEDAVEELSGKDPVEFERRLAALDADTRESVLETYAFRMGSADNRKGLLERAANSPHGEAMALYHGLLRRESKHDLQRAIATLQELGISTEDRDILDDGMVSVLMWDCKYYRPEKDMSPVLQGWVERNPDRRIPRMLLKDVGNWSRHDSERAVAWVAKQAPGFQYDALAKQLVDERTQSDDPDLTEFVGIAARIGDFNIRAEANRLLKTAWKPDDAAKVVEWEKSLPTEDQVRLKRDMPDE